MSIRALMTDAADAAVRKAREKRRQADAPSYLPGRTDRERTSQPKEKSEPMNDPKQRWSEQWTLGDDARPTTTSTIALRGPAIYGQQEVDVVPKQEAEQRVDTAERTGKQRLLEEHEARVKAEVATTKAEEDLKEAREQLARAVEEIGKWEAATDHAEGKAAGEVVGGEAEARDGLNMSYGEIDAEAGEPEWEPGAFAGLGNTGRAAAAGALVGDGLQVKAARNAVLLIAPLLEEHARHDERLYLGKALECLVDRTIQLARSSDRPDLAIRVEALEPWRSSTQQSNTTVLSPREVEEDDDKERGEASPFVEGLARALAEMDGWDWEKDGTSLTRKMALERAERLLEAAGERGRQLAIDRLDPLGEMRPASAAHVNLSAAVLRCLEAGIEPKTVRRFVDEELAEAQQPHSEPVEEEGAQGFYVRFKSRDEARALLGARDPEQPHEAAAVAREQARGRIRAALTGGS